MGAAAVGIERPRERHPDRPRQCRPHLHFLIPGLVGSLPRIRQAVEAGIADGISHVAKGRTHGDLSEERELTGAHEPAPV